MFTPVFATFAGICLVLTVVAGWAYFTEGRSRAMLALAGLFAAAAAASVASAVSPGLVYWVWWVPPACWAAMSWIKRQNPASPKPK